ncbi:DUF6283 family protein [Paracidovorax citrulli]|uniref:DUF6283 family protein n=1 Tax=Paracidovorax citrulli TaxID=80869 RepID=UPI003FA7CE2F
MNSKERQTHDAHATVVMVRPAGEDHQVVTLQSVADGKRPFRKEPCAQCPWREDSVGVFPPEAFKHSAATAYDMSSHTFGCHDSGTDRPAACAGFLLRGAAHNLRVRLQLMQGNYRGVTDGGHVLHDSYRSMAIANGVDPADPVLERCRE